MSIVNISTKTKIEVFKRLLKSNETFETACSKSALNKNIAKAYLAK